MLQYQIDLIQINLEVVLPKPFVRTQPPAILTLLGHPIRWQLLTALVQSDRRAQELAKLLEQPQNLISYHLHLLSQDGLVRCQRSRSDLREIYYSLNWEHARQLFFSAGQSLHPAFTDEITTMDEFAVGERKARVLFLCTRNSARSQMAEGLLRKRSNEIIQAFSAGTKPAFVHPLAIRALQEMNIDITHQHSKSLQEFLGQNFDYIITVCDRVREVCPVFPGDPIYIHWSIPDPVEIEGLESERLQAFREIALQLNRRIGYLLLTISQNSYKQ